uniref:Zinc-binding dehydrogenase n=1 Tax=Phenylobacterium glaciei TaxID=2803784 RepID=A0A974P1P3_9CAUL|nr:zinc-binding dehydrogenase [Phenylobacterium glaciei]
MATLPCAALTAWRGLFEDARLEPGDTVVLQGTGGVSIFGLQFARAAGYRTFITSSSDEKLARPRTSGPTTCIITRPTPNGEGCARGHRRVGADFIMEVGGGGTIQQSLRAIRINGHIAVIGVVAGAGGAQSRRPDRQFRQASGRVGGVAGDVRGHVPGPGAPPHPTRGRQGVPVHAGGRGLRRHGSRRAFRKDRPAVLRGDGLVSRHRDGFAKYTRNEDSF